MKLNLLLTLTHCIFTFHNLFQKSEARTVENGKFNNKNSLHGTPFNEYFDWKDLLEEDDFPTVEKHRIVKRDYNLEGYRKSCKFTFDVWKDKTIHLISPYNGKTQYPGGLDCEFVFVGTPDCKPAVVCETIDLRTTEGCTDDELLISDGAMGQKSFCGPHMGFSHPIISRIGTYMFVNFRTGDSTYFDRLYQGFNCRIHCHSSERASANQAPLPEGDPRKEEPTLLCGRKFNEGNNRIVGGTNAEKKEFPWLAALVYPGTRKPFCGGSLINNKFILTAAHCVLNDMNDITSVLKGSEVQILLKAYMLDILEQKSGTESKIPGKDLEDKKEDREEMRLDVDKIIVHQHYNKFEEFDSDVALLQLKLTLDLKNKDVPTPICLPEALAFEKTYEGQTMTASGWGYHHQNATGTAKIQQKVDLPTIPHQKCLEAYDGVIFISDHMFCAGFLEGGKDACQGDSGGPLVTKDGDKWVQAGIVSMGDGCAQQSRPGVYVHVGKFIPWILHKTRGSIWPRSNT